MSAHPALCLYGETAQRSFPLIMVVGREPNSDNGEPSKGVGLYDFDGLDSRGNNRALCAFWNISYRLAASRIEMTTSQLKQICRQKRASPIVYADALPRPIPNESINKDRERLQFEDHEIEEHADEVFSQIANRVSLCVLSGLNSDVFARPRNAFREHCDAQNIICIEVAFFHGVNARKIGDQAAQNEAASKELKRIMQGFIDSSE